MIIRPMLNADRDFVVSGWSASFRTSPYAGMLSMRTYATVMHAEIAIVLARPTTRVLVVAEQNETLHDGRQFLYGFIAYHADLAHPYVYYVYVKAPFRQGRARHQLPRGHASALFAAAGIDPLQPFGYACHTTYCDQLARKIPLAEHQSLRARYEEQHEQRDQASTEVRNRRRDRRNPHQERQTRSTRPADRRTERAPGVDPGT